MKAICVNGCAKVRTRSSRFDVSTWADDDPRTNLIWLTHPHRAVHEDVFHRRFTYFYEQHRASSCSCRRWKQRLCIIACLSAAIPRSSLRRCPFSRSAPRHDDLVAITTTTISADRDCDLYTRSIFPAVLYAPPFSIPRGRSRDPHYTREAQHTLLTRRRVLFLSALDKYRTGASLLRRNVLSPSSDNTRSRLSAGRFFTGESYVARATRCNQRYGAHHQCAGGAPREAIGSALGFRAKRMHTAPREQLYTTTHGALLSQRRRTGARGARFEVAGTVALRACAVAVRGENALVTPAAGREQQREKIWLENNALFIEPFVSLALSLFRRLFGSLSSFSRIWSVSIYLICRITRPDTRITYYGILGPSR